MIHLRHFDELDAAARESMAAMLVEGFGGEDGPHGWPTLELARKEVAAFDAGDRSAIAAEVEGQWAGWIGAIAHSDLLWELHPLVVHPAWRGKGIASHLVAALEEEAWRRGVCTMWLGSDDDYGGTNIHDKNVYGDIPGAIAHLEVTTRHPITFYRKMGYTVVGILPDAGGPGQHDILMAKRLEEESETE